METPGHISVPMPGDIAVGGNQGIANDTFAGSKRTSGLDAAPANRFCIFDKDLSDQGWVSKVYQGHIADKCPGYSFLGSCFE
jgi:hypothetical protein